MFITSKRRGYDSSGQQVASGLFLILTQPKTDSIKYPDRRDECHDCGRTQAEHKSTEVLANLACPNHGIMARLKARAKAKEDPSELDFLDASKADCSRCQEYERVKAEVGCQYFRAKANDWPIRAIVRFVSMQQCGHFMMGNARVKGEKLTLSGAYGSDGLPDTVSDRVYESGLELPANLREAWSKRGGWNGAGSEAYAMRDWALEHLKELRK